MTVSLQKRASRTLKLFSALLVLSSASAHAAPPPPMWSTAEGQRYVPAPARKSSEGAGPFRKLVIRGVTMIDGAGGPPRGPVDITIEGNRIANIRSAGTPGVRMKPDREPRDFDHEIDATGMYLLPGFVDTHGHGAELSKAPDLSYAYKLWLAHGVTTVRGVPLADVATTLSEKRRSEKNEIVAPRIFAYGRIGEGWNGGRLDTPAKAREFVRWAAAAGLDGVKFFNRGDETPEIDRAAIDEARKLKLGTVAHLSQNNVASFNADDAGAAGLGTVTHFYGHFESLLKDVTIQPFPADYNNDDESMRFGEVASIREHIHGPDTPQWRAYLDRQLERGVTFDPTFVIYSASRDLMKARTAEWLPTYTLPRLMRFFETDREYHGSYFYDWTSERELAWKKYYELYGRLMNDYKNLRGRVTVGTDAGYIWKLWGFSFVEEMEIFREAGFTPLEIVRAATSEGAASIYAPKGQPAPFGVVRRGMLADLIIVPENPMANLKVLYGTRHLRLNPVTNEAERVGGVRYTIKDGVVYDAPALLDDVAAMVDVEKRELATR